MRRLIVTNFMSLDGYYTGAEGDVMALPFDPTFDDYNLERVRSADTLLAGRVTYEQLQAFWVPLADAPAASELQQEIGRFHRDAHTLVVSDTLSAGEARRDTEIVRRDVVESRLLELKEEPGRDILVFGSRLTWNPLLRAGLVDELHLMVGCAAIGAGTPLFTGATARMRLLGVIRSEGSDNVVLIYAANKQDGSRPADLE